MRFVDFLKTTVLACAAGATALGALAVVRAAADDNATLIFFTVAWWTLAALIGAWLGRQASTLPAIARLLGASRASTTLPEAKPGRVLVNRLWPLLALVVVTAGLTWALPQVAVIAAGFMIIWALYWRRQDGAVTAIEERDGVAFYIEPTSPLKPMQLVRTPGFRRVAPPPSGDGLR